MNCLVFVEVIYKNMRFFIIYNLINVILNKFIEEFKKYGVIIIVRVCEVIYDIIFVEKEGIYVFDWFFDDGVLLFNQIVDDWLSFVKIKFCEEFGCCIVVYCVVGFGRVLVFVVLVLIEGGMKYEDVV